MSAEERAALGVGSGTVRVSVGIEDPDDIVADFTEALSR
jgi:cystathionine beta-lyase/cystathionine gamma-synthase